MKTTLTPQRLAGASARLMCLILFVIWGFVFVSHLFWFFPPQPVPPVEVWFGQAVQLGLIASYILFFFKQKAASILMVVCAFLFFFIIVGSGGAIAYSLLSIFPAIVHLVMQLSQKKKKPE